MYVVCCSVPLDGKKKAHEVGSMKRLIELMGDEDADVRANCAAAIMLYALSIFLFNSINIYKIIKVN